MKAVEMADRFKADPTALTARTLMFELLKEAGAIGKQRNACRADAVVAIFRQQEDKWKAFCRLCPEVNSGIFKSTAHTAAPELKSIWP